MHSLGTAMKITDVRAVNVCVPLSTFGTFEPVTMW